MQSICMDELKWTADKNDVQSKNKTRLLGTKALFSTPYGRMLLANSAVAAELHMSLLKKIIIIIKRRSSFPPISGQPD